MKSTLEVGEMCRIAAIQQGAPVDVFAGPAGVLLERGDAKATITPIELERNDGNDALVDLLEAKLRQVGVPEHRARLPA